MSDFDCSEAYALELDRVDPLERFRERFHRPPGVIYLVGNSLGLPSRDAEASLQRVLGEWREQGVGGWLQPERPWFYFAERLGALAGELVGAEPGEVVVTGSTTVNIHALVASFFEPRGTRKKILADALDFPSDIYALRDQLRLKGCDPREDLVLVPSRDGRTIEESDVIERMSDEVALVFLPSVLYRSGQLLDLERLTREAHARNIPIGFDCAHSVGAVPHRLHEWDVDFAVWCSYKYLNGGPGASAALFVHRRNFQRGPRITGWFGSRKEQQFEMRLELEPQPDAGGWQISSPGILGSASLEGSLGMMREVGIEAIRQRSLSLTSYLVQLAGTRLCKERGFRVGSPLEPRRRGGHVALEHVEAYRVSRALKERGVICDYRAPDVIRLAPVALYNTHHELWQVVEHLVRIVDQAEHLDRDPVPSMVP